jgi:hypothetical protein
MIFFCFNNNLNNQILFPLHKILQITILHIPVITNSIINPNSHFLHNILNIHNLTLIPITLLKETKNLLPIFLIILWLMIINLSEIKVKIQMLFFKINKFINNNNNNNHPRLILHIKALNQLFIKHHLIITTIIIIFNNNNPKMKMITNKVI